ncbi:unnamed protein product [Pieris macdunnoughi]|uniref:PiggyBac transposable element-derived protein domain-containing protein n=1 Tax=Pieris macdunnoughi TaxID=345717 RepID=A0A821X2H6_9NEOP|nr:unnamed protein product [Pieris macdunnoughi]
MFSNVAQQRATLPAGAQHDARLFVCLEYKVVEHQLLSSGDVTRNNVCRKKKRKMKVKMKCKVTQKKEEQSNTEQPVSTSAFRRIVALQQRTVRGKNKYCWSTSKPTWRGRVSAVNVVRTQRGPSRVCRNIYDPVICFNMFFTDAIIMEIVRWTNAEISLKRRASMTGATFRDTDEYEIRALFGILVMTAVRKDNHMSTDELFDRSSSMLYVSVNDKHCLH